MSFVQSEFMWFLAVVVTVYWLLPQRRWQNLFLLGASQVFYGWFEPHLCLLLLAVSVVDYAAGIAIEARPHQRDRFMAMSMITNLGILGYFKYTGFFLENVSAALTAMGVEHHMPTLKMVLPLGISFFTFQTMSYTIDVWRGQLKARKNFLDYMLFVSFFPQLVAGPIERASNLISQVEAERVFGWEKLRSGMALFMWGGFKKVAIADTIAPYVDLTFIHHEPSAAMIWAGALGFAVQILADFSGYTDMARGCARMLGFELMENFKSPYMAANPSEYWQRWHISFSTWLRDYVYLPATFSPWVRKWITIPFTGEWGPTAHTCRVFFITMLLSGLWHGASWICLAWGLYYAILLSVYHIAERKIPKAWKKKLSKTQKRVILVPLMFFWTWVGMIIFRLPSIEALIRFVQLDPFAGTSEQWVAASVMMGMTVVCGAPLVMAWFFLNYVRPKIEGSHWYLPLQTTAWAAFAVAMFTFKRITAGDFVYFQF